MTIAKEIGAKLRERLLEDLEMEFDDYMDSVLAALMDEFDVDEEEAVDFIVEVADSLYEEGVLPPFPDVDSSTDDVTEWVAAAQSAGFTGLVIEAA